MTDKPKAYLLDELFHGCAFATNVEAIVCRSVTDLEEGIRTGRCLIRQMADGRGALSRLGKTLRNNQKRSIRD